MKKKKDKKPHNRSKLPSPLTMEMYDRLVLALDSQDGNYDILDAYKNRKNSVQYRLFEDSKIFRHRLRNGICVLINCFRGDDHG